jgi:lipid A 3-O-deacylase
MFRDRKALGSHLLFHIPLEIGVTTRHATTLFLYSEHTPNGHMRTFNEGLDRIGVRYGAKF